MKNKKLKVCLISSSGGHLEQLKQLIPTAQQYDMFIVTEANKSSLSLGEKYKTYYMRQQERKSFSFFLDFPINIGKSIVTFLKEKPDVVISTGAGMVIPFCLFAKLYGKKVVFLESFAKINSPTITGIVIYRFADRFYVQWEEMKKHYPDAIYKGGIY
ncbi:polysaccharide biosynthesis protein [Pseudalkalibacillus caeni]|uniref:Polysaccharide biosynthesis protein n=2 Tax=Exobacillus caeni TaxID=2574798 RepID=A0A5R9F5V7_9BACL|nr:polysaccharide biosynthesis protein [Pseudalkalibacillus caeni]